MIYNGTTYDNRTPMAVVKVLDRAIASWQSGRPLRLRIFLGDPETGRDWGEENDVIGYIGRSNGTVSVPLLIPNRRSRGGFSVLDHAIVRIVHTRSKRVLYSHETYHRAAYRIGPRADGLPPEYTTSVWAKVPGRDKDWKNVANFGSPDKAVRYIAFMTGKRMSH
jgi:hypothetical protein